MCSKYRWLTTRVSQHCIKNMQFALSKGIVKSLPLFPHFSLTWKLSLPINQISLNTETAALTPDLAEMKASIKVHYIFTSAFLCLLHSWKPCNKILLNFFLYKYLVGITQKVCWKHSSHTAQRCLLVSLCCPFCTITCLSSFP